MPDLWMDVDAALAEVPVNVLALIDDTDFKSREEAVAYDAAGLELIWHFVTIAGATTATVVTPTTAGVYDWNHQDGGLYTIEIPSSGGGSINNDTEGFGWFSGVADGVLPWRGPTIGFRAAALNNALIDGGDTLDVNVTTVSDTAQTANDNGADINAILLDTAGLDGDAMRGTDSAALDSVATEARLAELDAAKVPADIDTLIARLTAARAGYLDNLNIGENVAGTSEITALSDLSIADVITALKNAGLVLHRAGISSVTSQTQFVIPATDDATDDNAYNNATAVMIDQVDPNQVSVRRVSDYDAASRTVIIDAAAEFTVVSGDILCILSSDSRSSAWMTWEEVLTGATHNIATSAGRRLRALQDFGLYEGGAIWIDTVGGTAGTTDFENGTVTNPVDSLADALTLSASLGLKVFHVLPGSSITLAAATDDREFIGFDYTVALGGQSTDRTLFRGCAVSGIYSGTPRFEFCTIGSITGPSGDFHACGLAGTILVNGVGDWFIHHSFSKMAGVASPSFDFGAAVLTTNLNMRSYSGGIEIKNMGQAVTDTASIEGFGQIILNVNCAGGTIAVRGTFTITDNAGGAVTLSDAARFDSVSLIDDWYDEVNTGAAHNIANSGGRQIREAATTGLYEGGCIWIDTVNGTAGTDADENGTVDNPSDNIADATTLAVAKGHKKFRIAPGSSFTLAQSYSGYIFMGDNGVTIALGGQSITGCVFKQVVVTGIATGTGVIKFEGCDIGTIALTCTLPPCYIHNSDIHNNIISNAVGDYFITASRSSIAGISTWSFDFGGAIGNTNLNMRSYSGGVQLESMGNLGTDVASIEGWGQVIEGTCAGGTVVVRGNFTVSGITNITLSDDARIDVAQINAEVVDALNVDTYPEPGQGIPPATASLVAKINYLFKSWRNEKNNDGSTTQLLSDDGVTVDQKQTTSEAAGVVTKGEWESGP